MNLGKGSGRYERERSIRARFTGIYYLMIGMYVGIITS